MRKMVICSCLMFILLGITTAFPEEYGRWVMNPNVRIDIVDRVEDEGRYSMYFCISEEFVVTIDRDLKNDTGYITMIRDENGIVRLYFETEWINQDEAIKTVNELVNSALSITGAI